MQETSCKRMRDHGALKANEGRHKLVGPARPQQRAREPLAQALAGLRQRADQQGAPLQAPQAKVAESAAQGHGTRLAQRQRTWAVMAKECHDMQDTQG